MTEVKAVAGEPTKQDKAEQVKQGSYILRDTAEDSKRTRYITAVRLGMTKEDAAAFSDIASSTVRGWVTLADESEEAGVEDVFTAFRSECRSGRAEMVARNLATVEKARVKGDWKAASWMLERHGYNKTTELTGGIEAQLTYTIDTQDLEAVRTDA